MPSHYQFQYQVMTEPVTVAAGENITEDKWHQPWSLPVRTKPPLPIGAYQFLAYSESARFPETVTEDRWHQPWSEPIIKAKIGLRTGDQSFLAFHPTPSPFVASGWFNWLSDPVRVKPRLPEGQQQFLFFHPAPSPFVATGWFNWLNDPVRLKPGLEAALQQFFATDTSVIPLTELIEWFAPFSDPVRIKLGLLPALQQFLAYHPRILPTPTLIGLLNALESGDSFVGSARDYNAVLSAGVGITELIKAHSPVTIVEKIQQLANVGIEASLPSTSSGAPVTQAVSANVSIREV